jgi:hypothetical protein
MPKLNFAVKLTDKTVRRQFDWIENSISFVLNFVFLLRSII